MIFFVIVAADYAFESREECLKMFVPDFGMSVRP